MNQCANNDKIQYTLFYIRTKFIRTLSLNFGEILRTFLTLKLPDHQVLGTREDGE